MKTAAIILLAGKSTRFGSDISKQSFLLQGKPVYTYPITTFALNKNVDSIVAVVDKKNFDAVHEFVSNKFDSKIKIVLGGETRQESVKNGLQSLTDFENDDIVIIHDCARPLINDEIIDNTIEQTKIYEAVTTYVQMEDTVATIDQNESLLEFVDRSKLVRIQTPQAFKYGIITEAHKKANDSNATDDCSLVMSLPHQVKLIPGSKRLTKLTTQEDLHYLETFLK